MTEQEFAGLGAARVDEEELAEAVRTYPILYVKSIKEFKDQKKKKTAWKNVAVLNTGRTHSFLLAIFPLCRLKTKQCHRKCNKCFFHHF